MKSNRFVYHYSARYNTDGGVADIDGIARLERKVLCQDDYRALKKLIEPEHFNKTTIVSLSFIGMEGECRNIRSNHD